MQQLPQNLQFKANIKHINEESACFRPDGYPPSDDFVMSLAKNGDIVSRYSDDIWDFKPFGYGNAMFFNLSNETNKNLFKQLMFYHIYSPLFPGKYRSLNNTYSFFKTLFETCSEYDISATELYKFPRVIQAIAKRISKSTFKQSIWCLDKIFKYREYIGFTILDEKNIARFKQFDPNYEFGQTAYIPARIWEKFIKYNDSVLTDIESHISQLKKLYDYVATATLHNETISDASYFTPFRSQMRAHKKAISYKGSFSDYLKENKLNALFKKYYKPRSGKDNIYSVQTFSQLLYNTVFVCLYVVLYYSLMRIKEARSLRIDCLKVEKDEQLGDIYFLVGETTKTDPDSDAHWVVPKSVVKAVNLAKEIVSWKMKYLGQSDSTPYLFQHPAIWDKSYRTLVKPLSYLRYQIKAEHSILFFKPNQYQITQDDYNEAVALTPNLVRHDWFKVNGLWNFSYHQFRRTLAVHFAVNRVPASSVQLQMKHGTREQQYYYQNNSGRLRLNQGADNLVVNEYYAEMGRDIESAYNGIMTFPYNKSPIKPDIVNIISERDMKKMLKAQKNEEIGFRKNIIGGCMKLGPCEYGGLQSIARCSGGDGGKPCVDLVIDGSREQEFKDDKADYESQMNEVPKDSPQYKSLNAEVKGYETILNIIKEKR
jgi:integrase